MRERERGEEGRETERWQIKGQKEKEKSRKIPAERESEEVLKERQELEIHREDNISSTKTEALSSRVL